MTLENSALRVTVGENGSLTGLYLKDDGYGANFLLSSEGDPWMPEDKGFGLGFVTAGFDRLPFGKPVSLTENVGKCTAEYLISYTDPRSGCVWSGDIGKSRRDHILRLTVTRELADEGLSETYVFGNEGGRYAVLDEIALYSSFRDVYDSGKDVLHRRFNQHICVCGDLCTIEAQRQSGVGSNVGLITLEGHFTSYQIEEQNTSNHRGVIALVSKDVRIGAGKKVTFRRVLTPYSDRADFEAKRLKLTGYPVLDCGRMTVVKGEPIRITVREKGALEKIKLGGTVTEPENGAYTFPTDAVGEVKGRIYYGGRIAEIAFRVIDEPDTLLKKRAEFIASFQQMKDGSDPRYGAFLVYDNDEERMILSEELEDTYHEVPDKNDARERLGMGAFLARYVREYGDARFMPNLLAYREFLLKNVVDENGDVWDTYLRNEGAKYYLSEGVRLSDSPIDMRFRVHNYAFCVPFFVEMYLLTGEESDAVTALRIMDRYYAAALITSFMPDLEDLCLPASFREKYSGLIASVKDGAMRTAKLVAEQNGNYLSDETAYEQGSCSSNLRFLTDHFLANGDRSVLATVPGELRRTETFEGNQPHYFQNGIPIRHWDAFWFGKYELWGDTMPHWISCQSACGYSNLALLTGEERYFERAKAIFFANLALIKPDGSSFNSYIFNEKTNGRPAGRYDDFANDQDWSLYYYMKYGKDRFPAK